MSYALSADVRLPSADAPDVVRPELTKEQAAALWAQRSKPPVPHSATPEPDYIFTQRIKVKDETMTLALVAIGAALAGIIAIASLAGED